MKRLEIMKVKKLSSTHLENRLAWLNHPDVYQYMNMQYPLTFEEMDSWYDRIKGNQLRIDLVFEEENEVVAMTGLTNIDFADGLAEYYILVNPDKQGQGFGKFSTQFTTNYAFNKFNLNKIYLYTNSYNERANKLYLNLGFQQEGLLRKHKFKNGGFIDRCIFGLLKDDWKQQSYSSDIVSLTF
ncbi:GNAT family N-acetyltransferase [Emticicia sp. 21SJ11W-3]|uniref:GNAT family N-acetyltransferase n=1 Tax=Emticicia sp. 21SJ11W-3 TaxID=2916755 RepID=UPI00209F6A40|nr:GNAT family protein [Emticicia sp. 21SJ11W-3]UTA69814.1 GNAT family N-acetyltransferase [Emticicia sp. 21SJ11W-3]